MYGISKAMFVDFAHHIDEHVGACINIHGHTWKFEIGLCAESLRNGMVMDFGDVKSLITEPVRKLLDHSLVLGDVTFKACVLDLTQLGRCLVPENHPQLACKEEIFHGASLRYPGGLKVVVFPFSPTSERLAKWFHDVAVNCLRNSGRAKYVSPVMFTRVYESLHPVEAVAEYVE